MPVVGFISTWSLPRLVPPSEVTPVTAVKNFLQATTLDDTSLLSDESLSEDVGSQSPCSTSQPQLWKDIDQAEANDHLFSSEYAPEVFHYMRQREVCVLNYRKGYRLQWYMNV